MNYIDIIICIFLLYGLVRGFIDGLFISLASLVGLLAGIYGAIHFSDYAAIFLSEKFPWSQEKINIAAFALTFIIIVVGIYFLGRLLTKIANFVALGIVNKLLGAAFGILKTAFILSVLMLLLNKVNVILPILGEEEKGDSVFYEPVQALAPAILPPILAEIEEE